MIAEETQAGPAAVLAQPFLFDEHEMPIREDLVHFSKSYDRDHYTAKILSKNEEFSIAVCELVLLGVSDRAIAQKMRIARRSVRAVVRVFEERGKLAPLKERMSAKMGELIELGLDVLKEKLELGEVPANVLPIVIGVLADKKALIDGDPTSIVDHRHTPESNVSVDQVRDYLDRMKRATVATSSLTSGPTLLVESAASGTEFECT